MASGAEQHGNRLELRCPRCGYDQAGMVATWGETCPLEGTCSECGLEYAWRDVFVPPVYLGMVEHARGLRGWAVGGLRTFLGEWRPRRFWTKMKLEHPLRVGLARVWLLCAVVVGVLGVPLLWRCLRLPFLKTSQSFTALMESEAQWWAEGHWLARLLPGDAVLHLQYRWLGYSGTYSRWPWVGGIDNAWNRMTTTTSWWLLPMMVMCSVSPAIFLLAPQTRGRAKVRIGHVARWWVYGQGWIVLLFLWQIGILFLGLVAAFTTRPFIPGVTTSSSLVTNTSSGLSILQRVSTWRDWLEAVPAPMESKWIVPTLWFVWLMWWNWCALRMGMRLLPAWMVFRVWGLLMVVAVLIGAAVVMVQELWFGVVVPR